MTEWEIYNIPGLTKFLPEQYSLYIYSEQRVLRSGRILKNNYNFTFMIRSNINLQEPQLARAEFHISDEIIDPQSKYAENYNSDDKEIYLNTLGSNIRNVGLGQFLLLSIAYMIKSNQLLSEEQQARGRFNLGLSDQTGRYGQPNNIYIKMGCETVGDESGVSCDINTILSKLPLFIQNYVDKGFFVDKKSITTKTQVDIFKLKISSPRHAPGFPNAPFSNPSNFPEILTAEQIQQLQKYIHKNDN